MSAGSLGVRRKDGKGRESFWHRRRESLIVRASMATLAPLCPACRKPVRAQVSFLDPACPECGAVATDPAPPPYRRVMLEQGTERWLAWREQGIGASDAPAILGENPWKSRERLLDEKLGRARTVSSPAMARGTALEPEARRHYERATQRRVRPVCLESTGHPWLRASLDGFSDDGAHVVEIKCGEKVHERTAAAGAPPAYYVGQLQHILAVTGLAEIDFWCWLPGRPHVHLRVARDENYIARMLEAEAAFWDELGRLRGA